MCKSFNELIKAYPYIFDKKGRVNANLSRSPNFEEISSNIISLTSTFPINSSIKERLNLLRANITEWGKCEVCKNPAKLINKTLTFTPFCSFKCSRSPGSSTFTKAQETCIERYGVKSNLVTQENVSNIKLKYGGIGNGAKSIKAKITTTNLLRFGCENPFGNKDVIEKIHQTHIKKYGGYFNTVKLGEKLKLLEDETYCKELASQFCLSTISEMLGVATNTIYKYFEKHNITNFNSSRSKSETEIVTFIKSLGITNIIQGDRQQLKPFEIDIYLPDYNLGIEFNGLYWHSELKGTKQSYHLNKLNFAIEKNINLIQIFENEWILKKEIIKSKIKSLVGKNSKIAARKCNFKYVDNKVKKDFLNTNHIQGDCFSQVNLGLYYNDTLVSIMTFSKSRFDKNFDFELLRYCCIRDHNVIGGFSKLLSVFRKENKLSSIVSYSDRRFSYGNVYIKNGFTFISNSKPSYHYFRNSSIIIENRMKFQKHKLEKIFSSNFDSNLSEWENMKNNNYNRIWDCGMGKWGLI